MLRSIVLDHWLLKLLSLGLATLLWMIVAEDESKSSVSLEALLEFRNLPHSREIVNRGTNRVSVVIGGPATLIRDISNRPLFARIDASRLDVGENMVTISPENISLPFGADVISVTPSGMRIEIVVTAED